jgi:hypothetical protein
LADTLSSSRADERYYSRNGCGRKPVARETSPGPSSAETASSWWLEQAATELEWMKQCHGPHGLQRFPPACYHLVKSLPGNDSCVDCGSRDTEWASPSYGALLCLQCSARHRSLGVEVGTDLDVLLSVSRVCVFIERFAFFAADFQSSIANVRSLVS